MKPLNTNLGIPNNLATGEIHTNNTDCKTVSILSTMKNWNEFPTIQMTPDNYYDYSYIPIALLAAAGCVRLFICRFSSIQI